MELLLRQWRAEDAFAAAGAICLVLSLLLQGFVLFWVIMICALGAAAVSCIVSLRFSRE